MTQEVLKLALKCAERCDDIDGMYSWTNTITAIKEALAQPEQFCDANCVWTDHHPDCKLAQPQQEPVAWMHVQGNYKEPSFRELADDEVERGWEQYPLYNTPPQRSESSGKPSAWVGLTDEEIDSYFEDHGWSPSESYYPVIKDIEAKLKEKNMKK